MYRERWWWSFIMGHKASTRRFPSWDSFSAEREDRMKEKEKKLRDENEKSEKKAPRGVYHHEASVQVLSRWAQWGPSLQEGACDYAWSWAWRKERKKEEREEEEKTNFSLLFSPSSFIASSSKTLSLDKSLGWKGLIANLALSQKEEREKHIFKPSQ